ncbi:MAG: hypothetical protein LUF30_09945 [Lachnospiraceae bacterium]|nr:hypothetical protein [Lachnospiraceae bacterium]
MTVQELFQLAETERVEEAYFLQHTIFYPYEKYSVDTKVDAVFRIKKSIREHIARFAACDAEAKVPCTIFVAELSCENYEDKGQKELYLFSVHDAEAQEKVQMNFALWNDAKEDRIEHYGIDMCKVEDIAGYQVAEASIENLGVTVCCAEILYEFFEFGYSDESKEKNIQSLYDSLDESMKEMDEGIYHSGEEIFQKIWQEMLDETENEDERQHMILKRKYEDSVREIEGRFREKVLEENHYTVIGLVRAEYDARR